jgi:transcriptional regulator with XRE-family HTH domain
MRHHLCTVLKMDKIKEVLNNIRNKRIALNYTQDYVAYKLNISQNAYSKIELGQTKISLKRLYDIADIFNMPLNDFFIL